MVSGVSLPPGRFPLESGLLPSSFAFSTLTWSGSCRKCNCFVRAPTGASVYYETVRRGRGGMS